MRVLFDTNVVLDIALNREPFARSSAASFARCEERGFEPYLAWHSLSNIFYILRRDRGAAKAIEFLEGLLSIVRVGTVGHSEALAAFLFQMPDLEDALQLSTAVACGADALVTRNTSDFKGAPIRILTPDEFIAWTPSKVM